MRFKRPRVAFIRSAITFNCPQDEIQAMSERIHATTGQFHCPQEEIHPISDRLKVIARRIRAEPPLLLLVPRPLEKAIYDLR
jgi:purine nucleoside permease